MLCAGFFIFTELYVSRQFEYVSAADTLYRKVEEGDATVGDAHAVMELWEDKRANCTSSSPTTT